MRNHAREVLFVELARALHSYGTPAHTLELAMSEVGQALDLTVDVFATPTSITFGFGGLAHHRAVVTRVLPGSIDLARWTAVEQLRGRLCAGQLSVREAVGQLRAIQGVPTRYPALAKLGASALASAMAALFFEGGIPEVLGGAVVGAGIGAISMFAARDLTRISVFEPAAATFASAASLLLASQRPGLAHDVVLLAGLVVLLPGMSLTVAMSELATRNLQSGTARLMGAGMVFVSLAFGVGLGASVASLVTGPVPVGSPTPMSPGWLVPALAASAVAHTVLLNARLRDLPALLAGSAVAYFGARTGRATLGPELGALLGALGLGIAGNLYSRVRRRPSAVLIWPGLLVLVPGSLGFRSVSSMLDHDVQTALEMAFNMALVGVSLAIGLLLAGLVVAPLKPESRATVRVLRHAGREERASRDRRART